MSLSRTIIFGKENDAYPKPIIEYRRELPEFARLDLRGGHRDARGRQAQLHQRTLHRLGVAARFLLLLGQIGGITA